MSTRMIKKERFYLSKIYKVVRSILLFFSRCMNHLKSKNPSFDNGLVDVHRQRTISWN